MLCRIMGLPHSIKFKSESLLFYFFIQIKILNVGKDVFFFIAHHK